MVEAIGVNASVTFNGREISIITKDSTRIILRDALTGLDCGQANDLGYVTLIANGNPSTIFFDRKELLVMARLVAAIKGVPVEAPAPIRAPAPAARVVASPPLSKPKKPWTVKRVAGAFVCAMMACGAVLSAIPQDPAKAAAHQAEREQTAAAGRVAFEQRQAAAEIARSEQSERDSATMAALKAEPQIKDVLHQPGAAVEWQVGVISDGQPRYGYAGYVCEVLRENGSLREDSIVRVVNIVQVVRDGKGFHEASLGAVRCSDRSHFDQANPRAVMEYAVR